MDIQQYINQNQDYLVKFKELGFHYKQYNVLGLTIVKYKHNTVFDDFNIKFKSIIINQKNNKIVSIAPMKSWKNNSPFYENIVSNKKITNKIPVNKLKKLFNFSYHTKKINIIFKRSLKK